MLQKWLLVSLLFFICKYSDAQLNSNNSLFDGESHWKDVVISDPDSLSISTGWSGSISTSSDALTNQFINSFFLGNYIGNDLKNSCKLLSSNFFRANVSNEVYFSGNFNRRTGYLISLSENFDSFIKFSKDYFDLLFFGNEMFAGKIADISGFRLDYSDYYQFRFGFFRRFLKNGNLTLFASASLLYGKTNYTFGFNNAKVYTGTDGEIINCDLNYYYKSTVPAESGANGKGIGVAGDFIASYTVNKSKININLMVENAGKIFWSDKSTLVSHDTSLTYTGTEVQNILDLGNADFSKFSTDSLKKKLYYSRAGNGSFSTILTRKITANINIPVNDLVISSGVYYYTNSEISSPVYFCAGRKNLFRRGMSYADLLFQLAYENDSGELLIGTGFEFKIKSLFFRIGSGNIFGYLFPDHSCSQSLNLQLIYRK